MNGLLRRTGVLARRSVLDAVPAVSSFIDTFARANQNPVGYPYVNSPSNATQLLNNTLQRSSGSIATCYLTLDEPDGDLDASMTLTGESSHTNNGIIFNSSGHTGQNAVFLTADGFGTLQGGLYSDLGGGSYALGSPHVIRLTRVASHWTAFIDGSVVHSWDDATAVIELQINIGNGQVTELSLTPSALTTVAPVLPTFTDTFNRSNANPIGAPYIEFATQHGGSTAPIIIVAGKALTPNHVNENNNTDAGTMLLPPDLPNGDLDCTATLYYSAAPYNGSGIGFTSLDSTTHVNFVLITTAGVATVQAQSYSDGGGLSLGAGTHTVRLRRVDTTYEAYIDGALHSTWQDSAYPVDVIQINLGNCDLTELTLTPSKLVAGSTGAIIQMQAPRRSAQVSGAVANQIYCGWNTVAGVTPDHFHEIFQTTTDGHTWTTTYDEVYTAQQVGYGGQTAINTGSTYADYNPDTGATNGYRYIISAIVNGVEGPPTTTTLAYSGS